MLFTINKRLQIGRVIRSLTLHDVTYWGSFDMLMVIFALFVVEQIEGGSASDVGIALFIYKAISVLVSIPLGTLFDSLPGLRDEQVGLFLSSIITGTMYVTMAFARLPWQVFVIMAVVGIARSINLNSWRKIFNKSLDATRTGSQLAVYDSFFSIGTAMMNVLAGFMSEIYGVTFVLVITGGVVLVGAMFPLFIGKDIRLIPK